MIGPSFAEAFDQVKQAPFLLDGYRATEKLVAAAAGVPASQVVDTLASAIADDSDQLTAIASIHALGGVFGDRADVILSDLLSHRKAFIREHAAWAMGPRLPRLDAIGRLVNAVTVGGFSGVLAQRTLARWAANAPDHVALALEGRLSATESPQIRARLIETLGLVPGTIAAGLIRRAAASADEKFEVRRSAVAAIGDRGDDPFAADVVHQLAGADDELAATAQLAAYDLARRGGDAPTARGRGLTVAQLFLHADLDPEVSKAGAGDNGGIATLLVRLGGALAAEHGIDRVLTLSRGSAEQVANSLGTAGDNLLVGVPLLPETLNSTQAWPAWVAAERGIRRALLANGPVDVLHLRMGEVGSMAAAAAAQSLDIPIVFTLAPDPHSVIHALDMTGSLSRANFGLLDAREHFWFRLHLVRRLADSAARIVLFPRSDLANDLKELLGLDIAADPGRYHVVPEGIDLTVTNRALREAVGVVAGQGVPDTQPVDSFAVLADLIRRLPEHRRGLPIAITVGRLHRVKGMATVVQAWAQNDALRDRCNLLVVGGDLAAPSPDEQSQLAAMDQVLQSFPQAVDGLILAGHQSNDTVARWLAAVRLGLQPELGSRGIYVCGSLKEEFGLAILEGLAAGLVVVAPETGGPATYVEPERTGVLVDTADPVALGDGMIRALDLAGAPTRGQNMSRAQRMVAEKFTVQAMARSLSAIYADVAATPPVASRRLTGDRLPPEMFGLSKLSVGPGLVGRA